MAIAPVRSRIPGKVDSLAKLVLVATALSGEVLADNPVGFWRLSETSGTVASDSSGRGNHGTYVNGPTLGQSAIVAGDPALNHSVLCGASLKEVQVASSSSIQGITTDYTYEIWFKGTGAWNGNAVIGRRGPSGTKWQGVIRPKTDGNIRFFDHNGTSVQADFSTTGGYSQSAVHHVVFTRSATAGASFYVDGSLVGTSTVGLGQNFSSTTGIFLGDEDGTGACNSYIAAAAVYNYALSQTRIVAHYDAGT